MISKAGAPISFPWRFVWIIAAMLIAFAAISYKAVLTKSPTYDEPLHGVAGFIHRTQHDFRIDPEDPPVFGWWGSLPQPENALRPDYSATHWVQMPIKPSAHQWQYVVATLFQTPGIDAKQFINRSRFMFVIVGMALGAMIACFAGWIGGRWAALVAAALFSLDPNFLAHSALIKNDVMLSLCMIAMALCLWRIGIACTWRWLFGLAVTVAIAANVKFSGVLCGPLVVLILLLRALLPYPWVFFNRSLATRFKRVGATLAITAGIALSTMFGIWASYGFRFGPSPDAAISLDLSPLVFRVQTSLLAIANPEQPSFPMAEIIAKDPGLLTNMVVLFDKHHLLPQAWLFGFLYTYSSTLFRASYLLGMTSNYGWWYYFPCAILFKTPIATIVSMISAVGLAIWNIKTKTRDAASPLLHWWTAVCLLVPPLVYLGSAMHSNLNLGLRHVLPIYPFIFVVIGTAFAGWISRQRRAALVISGGLLALLAIETFSISPDYLSFFNLASGGPSNGISLLGDSNLDWGQDLPALAEWRKAHPEKQMYLSYFGIASPECFGVDAINVTPSAGGWPFDEKAQNPRQPCYLAVSATNLQGIYITDPRASWMYTYLLRHQNPIAILHHTIYIFDIEGAGPKSP